VKTRDVKTIVFLAALLFAWTGSAHAQAPDSCDLPAYLLFSDSELKRVAQAVQDNKRLDIAVLGTASSALAGPDGGSSAYPARLQAALSRRLPGVMVNVVSLAKSRRTTADMAGELKKLLAEIKPALVLWQTGTFDAIRGVDPAQFRETLEDGVADLQAGGADVVLINMQYSPRTESMIHIAAYADSMRAVARERDVPLFDRLALMRYWNDVGAFDFYAAGKDRGLAVKVHDCLGRALAALIFDAAKLEKPDGQAGQ